MKKLVLAMAIAITACNLTLGVAFAATCADKKGSRFCGATCTTSASGGCECTGACSKEERDWVAGKSGGDEGFEIELFDY